MFWVSSLILLAVATLSRSSPHAGGASWSYSGPNGVDHWASVFPLCGGTSQSPIDLAHAIYDPALEAEPFQHTGFDTVDTGTEWTMTNHGHVVDVRLHGGNYKTQGGGLSGVYKALQIHFHWGSTSSQGSEHFVAGGAYPMEMHIVHKNELFTDAHSLADPEGLAVLGVLFRVSSEDNPKLVPVVTALAQVAQEDSFEPFSPIAIADLLPANTQHFYRYKGSLTTPTCNEAVVWTVFSDPVEISENQLAAFRNLLRGRQPLVDNFRPIQPLNDRQLRASFHSPGEATGEIIVESNGGEVEPAPEVEHATESNDEMEYLVEELLTDEILVENDGHDDQGHGEDGHIHEHDDHDDPGHGEDGHNHEHDDHDDPGHGEDGHIHEHDDHDDPGHGEDGHIHEHDDHDDPGHGEDGHNHEHDDHDDPGHGEDGHIHEHDDHDDPGHGEDGHIHEHDDHDDPGHGEDGHIHEHDDHDDPGHGEDGHNHEHDDHDDPGHGEDGHIHEHDDHDDLGHGEDGHIHDDGRHDDDSD